MSSSKPYRISSSKLLNSRKISFSQLPISKHITRRNINRQSQDHSMPSSSSHNTKKNNLNDVFRIKYNISNRNNLNKDESSMIPSIIRRITSHEKRDPYGIKKTEYGIIPFTTLKGLKKGNGGYAGIVPWYTDEIEENGNRVKELKLILNTSVKHNGLLSYIGGGIKKAERPIEGIYREIHEETPQWEEYFIQLLKNKNHPKFILMSDTYYPNSMKRTRSQIRYSILIFLKVDPNYLLHSFVPSSEIAYLNVMSIPQLIGYRPPKGYHSLYKGAENGLSSGVNDLRKMILSTRLFVPFLIHLKKITPHDEFQQLLDSILGRTNHEFSRFFSLSNYDEVSKLGI